MNVLFVTRHLIAADLVRKIQAEGSSVRLCMPQSNTSFDGIAQKISYKEGIEWVTKQGLIIFDDVGFGKKQDALRKKGYTVFGGSAKGDLLETNRAHAQKVFAQHGLTPLKTYSFDNIVDTIAFIQKNKAQWVLKQDNGNKNLNTVSVYEDSRDIIAMLKEYLSFYPKKKKVQLTIQEYAEGVEIGVGRYFNGTDFVGPIEINVEHTRLFPHDLGPLTSEMGTVAWFSGDESMKLYIEGIKPFKTYLKESKFIGDFEINFIATKQGLRPLEATMRFGSPAIHIQQHMFDISWTKFLHALAQGKQYEVTYKKGYGVVTLLAVPPFPYGFDSRLPSPQGIPIDLSALSAQEMKQIHFEDIKKQGTEYVISDRLGYVLYTTGSGGDIQTAREESVRIARKIVIPRVLYRTDIGEGFEKTGMKQLKVWGYL